MRRVETYVGSQVYEWVDSAQAQNTMTAMAKLCSALFGTNGTINGLACTPTSPATMTVQIGAGEVYQMEYIEATACGTLPVNTAYSILKQGIQFGTYTTGTFAAPSTSGQSINYLIEAQYQDQDLSLDPTTGNSPVVLQFYNSTNPSTPWSGPNNSGSTSNTFRDGIVAYQVKAGVAATTGSQVTPSPDTGWLPVAVVTVPYGASSLTSANISAYPGAPILPASGLLIGAIQQDLCTTSVAGGTSDAITASFSPAITSTTLSSGVVQVAVRAASANATTTPTFTPNSGVVSPATIVKGNGQALAAGDIAGAGHWIWLTWDATLSKWVLLNPATGVSIAAAGNLGGYVPYNTTPQTLNTSQLGKMILYWGTANGTFNLPAVASVTPGQGYWIVNDTGSYTLNVVTNGTDTLANGGVGTSLLLGPGDSLYVVAASSGTQWICFGGSAQYKYSAAAVSQQSISASVASNALTVGYAAGQGLTFRNSTLNNGTPLQSVIGSALSLTVPSGATLGTTSGQQAQLALVVLYNSGAPALGIINLAGGYNLDETTLLSTTAISSGATSATTAYSTSAISNSPFRVVGYINITEATAGTWATAPTLVQGQGGQAMAAMQSMGFGQTRQDVHASRAAGTTYYNATPRPIYISICINVAYAYSPSLTVGGFVCANWSSNVSQTSYVNYFEMVMPGESYVLSNSGTPTVISWVEVR